MRFDGFHQRCVDALRSVDELDSVGVFEKRLQSLRGGVLGVVEGSQRRATVARLLKLYAGFDQGIHTRNAGPAGCLDQSVTASSILIDMNKEASKNASARAVDLDIQLCTSLEKQIDNASVRQRGGHM